MNRVVFCFLVLMMSGILIASAEDRSRPAYTIEGGLGAVSGEVKYRIEGVHLNEYNPLWSMRERTGWATEMQYPQDMMCAEVGATARGVFNAEWDWEAGVRAWKNLTDPDAKVTQTDWYDAETSEGFYQWDMWRYPTDERHGRVYSESATKLNAFGYDGKIKLVKATEAGPIAGVAGFRYHQLSYKTRGMEGYADGTDWAGIPSGPIQSVPNSQDVFSYDLWSGIPYLGLGYEFTCFKRLHGSVECDYSQWASVKDRDRHMLQNSRYESQTDGTAWIFNLTLRYDVTAQWFAMFMADSLSVDTDGETTKMVYQPTAASPRAMMYHGPIEISERETRVSVGVGRRL